MMILRSGCLALGLLFTSLALRNSAVQAQQASEMATVTDENGISVTGADAVFVSKDVFEGVPAAAAAAPENKRLGGRKLVLGSILMKNMMEEEEAASGKTSKISGEDMNASNKPLGISQKYMKDQKTMASQLKSQDSEAVLNCGSLDCSSRSRKLVSPEYHGHFHKTESKKLLEAANEIVSLIHKDYSGMNRPRRKPPINNHEPLGRSQKP